MREAQSNRDCILQDARLWYDADIIAVLETLSPSGTVRAKARSQPPRALYKKGLFYFVAVLGMVAILAVGGWVNLPWADAQSSQTRATLTQKIYETPVEHGSRIDLPDGSHVQLGPKSRLVVAYWHRSRDLSLDFGEARFDTVEDSVRPVKIRAGQTFYQTNGGNFHISLKGQTTPQVNISRGTLMELGPSGLPVPKRH